MEILVLVLLIAITFFLYKKIIMLQKHLELTSFSEKVLNRLLVKKGVIESSEIDIAINEAIGDMYEDQGTKLIKNAKVIGVNLPKYMDDKELEVYVQQQETNRKMRKISFTDRILMEENNFK